MNDKEHKEIESKAEYLGLTISEYGRQLMLKCAVLSVHKKDISTSNLHVRTFIGIANNLNQLTRSANQRKELPQIESLLNDIESVNYFSIYNHLQLLEALQKGQGFIELLVK